MDLRKGWGAFWDGARGLSGAAPGVLAFAANEPISGRSPRLRPASWLHSAASAIPEPPIFSGEGKSPEEQKPHKSRFGPLWAQILGALVLGSFTGYLLAPGMGLVSAPATANILSWLVVPSDIFLSFLKMVAGPLVFASIVQAIGTHEDSGQLKSLSWKVLLYYTFTSLVATTIGAAVAFLVQPGSYFDGTAGGVVPAIAQTTLPGFGEFLRNLVPKSPISPFIDGNMLQIVLLGVLTGAAFLGLKEKAKAALEVVGSVRSLAMTLVRWSMYLAPLAVFGLMAKVVSTTGVQALVGMGVYMGTVVLGLAVMIGFYSLLIKFVGKLSPLKFFKHSKEAILTGFSTASSATAMPISMDTAQNKLGVSPAVSKLLISLGAAVNMEGTALYQVVATIFLAQVFGIPLSLGALALIIGITLASSLGTPGTPGAGIVILATVLTSVGIPLEGIALILGVDRILDMCRTAINVVGDLTSAVVMDAVAKKR